MLTYNEELEIKAFQKQMFKVLDLKSNEKLSWLKCDIGSDIGISLHNQFIKLESAIYNDRRDNEEIRRRAIHVANYCMMVWSLSSD